MFISYNYFINKLKILNIFYYIVSFITILVIKINNLPAFLIDSKTRQGQSGSPVIYYSESGFDPHYKDGENIGKAVWGCPFMREVGIYSGRINKDSDLGYVWKWEVIKEILDSIQDK